MWRRGAVAAIVLVGVLTQSNQPQARQFAAYGASDTSCGSFSKATGANRAALEWWILGFVSGAGYGRNVEFGSDPAGLTEWAAKYCSENPLEILPHAAIGLVKELESRRARPATKPPPRGDG